MAETLSHTNRRRRWMLLSLFFAIMAMTLGLAIAGPLRSSRAAPAASQPYTWNNVVTGGGGGFVDDIIFNQKQKDLIYARTDIGGAYRWNPSHQYMDAIAELGQSFSVEYDRC